MAGTVRSILIKKRRAVQLSLVLISIAGMFSCSTLTHSNKRVSGIGVSVLYDSSKQLTYIVDIVSSSPAAEAGLRSGDYLIKADSISLRYFSPSKVLKKLKGNPGSELFLVTKRGSFYQSYSIKRAPFTIPTDENDLCFKLEEQISHLPETEKSDSSIAVLPGFESASKGIFGIRNIYYRCKDTLQARRKFEHLISSVNTCLNFTIADSVQQIRIFTNPINESVEFRIEKSKHGNPQGASVFLKAEYLKDVPTISLIVGFRLRY